MVITDIGESSPFWAWLFPRLGNLGYVRTWAKHESVSRPTSSIHFCFKCLLESLPWIPTVMECGLLRCNGSMSQRNLFFLQVASSPGIFFFFFYHRHRKEARTVYGECEEHSSLWDFFSFILWSHCIHRHVIFFYILITPHVIYWMWSSSFKFFWRFELCGTSSYAEWPQRARNTPPEHKACIAEYQKESESFRVWCNLGHWYVALMWWLNSLELITT